MAEILLKTKSNNLYLVLKKEVDFFWIHVGLELGPVLTKKTLQIESIQITFYFLSARIFMCLVKK